MSPTRPIPSPSSTTSSPTSRERHLYRPLRVMSSAQGPIVLGRRPRGSSACRRTTTSGLTHHPRFRAAALEAVREFGVGSGAVRTIAGTMALHEALEAELAEFKGTPAVLTFQSGFTANTGVIPTDHRRDRPDRVRRAQPRLDHRRDAPVEGAPRGLPARATSTALRDGPRARPRATGRPTAATVPAHPRRDRRRLLDGRRHRAAARRSSRRPRRSARPSCVDDAHASGVLGRNGRGTVDHFGLHGRVAIQVGTLSKAVGSLGGYVAGSQRLRDILTQRARPFLFSTSHPPAVVAACREAIRVMWTSPSCRSDSGRTRAGSRRSSPGSASTPGHSETPITPVMMGDPDTAGRFSDRAHRGGRLRPARRLPDRRDRQVAPPDDRHRGPRRRAARQRTGRVRPGPFAPGQRLIRSVAGASHRSGSRASMRNDRKAGSRDGSMTGRPTPRMARS